jgi:hypothetical protein
LVINDGYFTGQNNIRENGALVAKGTQYALYENILTNILGLLYLTNGELNGGGIEPVLVCTDNTKTNL